MQPYAYGYPRLGETREYKKSIENFWKAKISEEELKNQIQKIEKYRLNLYRRYVDKFPVGEMTLYDNMLDSAILIGLYNPQNLDEYYKLCRGKGALQLKKWFNTNYHYLIPDFKDKKPDNLKLNWQKYRELKGIYDAGILYLIGPFSLLKLSEGVDSQNFEEFISIITEIYSELIPDFPELHIDEPCFVLDLNDNEIKLIKVVYNKLGVKNKNLYIFTYYDSVDFLKELYDLPIKAIGLDFVNGKENFSLIKRHRFPDDKLLIAGIVNGRNIWRTNLKKTAEFLTELSGYAKNLAISNASPLYHLPLTIQKEKLDGALLKKMAFAQERLQEINLIAKIYNGETKIEMQESLKKVQSKIQEKVRSLKTKKFKRISYEERAKKQKEVLNLPVFPTTTIGSFPQNKELRKKRKMFKEGKISLNEYNEFIKEQIKKVIKLQEETGLDVLVHGEFERTDMVEFFAQKLGGVATTENGWIISYGTRVYRPPIIYEDVYRKTPLTIDEITFAQSLTEKPLKGMLTGPVTITSWSYVREDIPFEDVVFQIALSLKEEIRDYEDNGIKVIQIDEPAFREKTPLKKKNWEKYFQSAVNSFNFIISDTKPQTQIHTHMCYSEFEDIIDYILKMDFDVITIESYRNRGKIIEAFKDRFNRQIGPGLWDIHSPQIPEIKKMKEIIEKALKIFPKENIWLNPDCGLKTREWEEVTMGLRRLIELREELKERYGNQN